jgi:hypothetical protein
LGSRGSDSRAALDAPEYGALEERMTYTHTTRDGRQIQAVLVNGTVYEVLSTEQDRQGELLAIRRPNGSKAYAARPIADTTYGACRAAIICTL